MLAEALSRSCLSAAFSRWLASRWRRPSHRHASIGRAERFRPAPAAGDRKRGGSGTDGSQTLPWRETDSNHRSLAGARRCSARKRSQREIARKFPPPQHDYRSSRSQVSWIATDAPSLTSGHVEAFGELAVDRRADRDHFAIVMDAVRPTRARILSSRRLWARAPSPPAVA
jgi:hypothetical protein